MASQVFSKSSLFLLLFLSFFSLFIQRNVGHVKVDWAPLSWNRIEAEPFEGLDLFLIFVHISVLQVDVFWLKNTICNHKNEAIRLVFIARVSDTSTLTEVVDVLITKRLLFIPLLSTFSISRRLRLFRDSWQ